MQRIPFRHIPKRTFFTLRTKPLTLPHPGPPTLQNERVDEERLSLYNSKSFYPVKPGEILGDKYQALVKLGWGTTSTVWLAKDVNRFRWRGNRCITLKISNSDSDFPEHERDLENYIAKQDPTHEGHDAVRTYLESFEVIHPEDKEKSHLCLVYEPMREPFWLYQRRFVDGD